MLIEICQEEKLIVSEGAIFMGRENHFFDAADLILDVSVNENELTEEITRNIHYQFWKDEKHYSLDKKNIRFTYEDIKNYFVYMDAHMLSLLNANEGLKEISKAEKELFDSAERLNIDGILKAISNGADINALDIDGETAITKIIRACKYDFVPINDKEAYEKFKLGNPEFTNEEKIIVAQKLLDMGADINFFGYDGLNGLQYTSYHHNPALMKFLLDNGANPNFNYFPEDRIPIISSALDNVFDDYHCYGDTEVLDEMEALLIKAGAKISEEE